MSGNLNIQRLELIQTLCDLLDEGSPLWHQPGARCGGEEDTLGDDNLNRALALDDVELVIHPLGLKEGQAPGFK